MMLLPIVQIITKLLCSRLFFSKSFLIVVSVSRDSILRQKKQKKTLVTYFFCFSTLYLFAAGGTLMMPFQNGHIIFKKPLVNNFRVAYVDTNCYSPHLPSPQQCTVQSSLLLLTKKKNFKARGKKNLLVLPVKRLRPLQFDRKSAIIRH